MRKLLSVLSFLLVILTAMNISTATWWLFYQPRVPKCIRR